MACCVFDELLIGKFRDDDFTRHRVRKRNVRADINTEPHIGPLCRTGPARVDDEQFGAAAKALQKMMEKDWMGLPRIRAPEQDHVRFFNFAVGTRSTSCSENRRQTGDARGVSSTVATIDVVAADDGAHEFLRDVVQLIGGFRTTEHAECPRPARRNLALEAFSRNSQRFVPTRCAMFAVFTNQGSCKPFACRAGHKLPPATRRAFRGIRRYASFSTQRIALAVMNEQV